MKNSVIIACVLLAGFSTAFSQDFSVIPVPYRAMDPSIPHPSYNGHTTLFKAIARGDNISTEYYYRWDFDGDMIWDRMEEDPVNPLGNWYKTNGYMLEGRFVLPEVDPAEATRKLFMTTIEVALNITPDGIPDISVFASYPVIVYADIPSRVNADMATDEQLYIMKEVALDDALWFLHKSLTRSGQGVATIQGYLNSSNNGTLAMATAAFLLALEQNGHLPAYMTGTYNDYGIPVPEGFIERNDFLWNNDPYAEDAVRMYNYILNNMLGGMGLDPADESDDGLSPIPGTNDLTGLFFPIQNHELNEQAFSMAAIAGAGLAGTAAQVGTLTVGQSNEFIVQQMVDWAVYLQFDGPPPLTGGWCYGPTGTYVLSHITGGWIYALEWVDRTMSEYGVIVNELVKNRIPQALINFQNPDGGVGWSIATMPSILEPVGLFLLGCQWFGWDEWDSGDTVKVDYSGYSIQKGVARTLYDKYIEYTVAQWPTTDNSGTVSDVTALWSDGNYKSGDEDHAYSISIFNIRQAGENIRIFEMPPMGPYDWFHEIYVDLVLTQLAAGSFNLYAGYWFAAAYLAYPLASTALSCLTLTLKQDIPVAIAQASPMSVAGGCAGGQHGKVTFYHDQSFHHSDHYSIVEYQWIFDVSDTNDPGFDLVDWGAIPPDDYGEGGGVWHGSSPHITPVFQYMIPGKYTAALRVIDDTPPPEGPRSGIDLVKGIRVNAPPNYPPVADAGGPYLIYDGWDLVLAGSGDDPNLACGTGEQLTYRWDLNNDGLFNEAVGQNSTVMWATLYSIGLQTNTKNTIAMQVTDKTGESDSSHATLVICKCEYSLGKDTSFCLGDTLLLDAGSRFISYLWNNDSTSRVLQVTAGGTYSVEVTDSLGCTCSDEVIVTCHIPAIVDLGEDREICSGESVQLDAGAGFKDYLWNDGSTGQAILADTAGAWYVDVTDQNGCKVHDTIRVIVHPDPVVELGMDRDICTGDQVVLDAGAGYSGYLWNDQSTGQTLLAGTASTWYVDVTDQHGCTGSDTVRVDVHPNPVVDLGADRIICEGGQVELDAGTGFVSYLWSDESGTQVITVDTTGLWTVIVTDQHGCTGQDEVYVSVQYTPPIILGVDTVLLDEDTLVLDAGTGYVSYEWNDGSGSSTHTIIGSEFSPGDYLFWVIGTDSAGCTATDSIWITIFEEPVNAIEILSDGRIRVWPNPFRDHVSVEIELYQMEKVTVAVFDMHGRRICQYYAESERLLKFEIDLSREPPGIYLLQVNTGNQLINRKLILYK